MASVFGMNSRPLGFMVNSIIMHMHLNG